MSKGSRRRPHQITQDALASRWAHAFGGRQGPDIGHTATAYGGTPSVPLSSPACALDLTVDGPMPHGEDEWEQAA